MTSLVHLLLLLLLVAPSLSFHLPLCSAVCTCFGAVLVATGDELSGESFPSFQLRAAPSSFFAPFCAPGLLPGEEIEC